MLAVNQTNDYSWMAILPEMALMWAEGHSEDEARDNWLDEYDNASFSRIFDAIAQQRAEKHLTEVDGTAEAAEQQRQQRVRQRPATIDFPFRGRLYRIATNEGLPKRHIVLPSGTVLVVCGWAGRVPAALADVRRSIEPMSPAEIAAQLDGVVAEEVPLQPGQTTKAVAIFDDTDGQRYTIDHDSGALVTFPDGSLRRVDTTFLGQEPVRIATMTPVPYQLDASGDKTPAIPVNSEYPGMAHEPRDLRICFSVEGERYILSHEAYEQHKWIVYVPDHGYYEIGIYLQSSPLQLGRLAPVSRETYIDPQSVAVALRLEDAVGIRG